MKLLPSLLSLIFICINANGVDPDSIPFRKPTLLEDYQIGSDTYRVILDPRHRTVLSAEVPAAVTQISKRLGDSFIKDEILIRLDDRVFKARQHRAKAQIKNAKASLETQQKLYKDNIASLVELRKAEAEAATAEAELEITTKNLEDCTIRAPYNGKIVNFSIEEHELAEIGDELVEIVDDEILIAKLLILSKHLPKLTIGAPLNIQLDDTGDLVTATITRIGAVIDPASSTIEVEADIDNRNSLLKAGMSGTAAIE